MRLVTRLLGLVLLGALICPPLSAAGAAAGSQKNGSAPAASSDKAAGKAATAENAERTPVKIAGDILMRPELQAFQGVRGWLVNGREIKLDEVKDRAIIYHGPFVLQDMVIGMLLEQEAKRRGVTVKDSEVDDKVKEVRQEWGVTSEAALDFYLRRNGHTRGWLRQKAYDAVMMEKVLGDQVYVSDKEVAAFFDQYRDQYRRPEAVDFRVIVLPTEKDAQAALSQIRSGRTFQQVAKDLVPADEKPLAGELRTSNRGQQGMPPELDAVLFSAPLDQVVGPIKSATPAGTGYYLLKVEKKRDAYQFTLDETRDIIRTQLRKQKLEQGVWPNWVQAQLSGAEIETLK